MLDINKRRSEKMKQNFKDGKIKGWSINSDKNRRSYPESFFIKVFKKNKLYDKYTIEEKFSYGKYFIDFLFVEIKLIVEIDGEQHFKNDETISYDNNRDNFFINEGFKIYRIRWKDVFNNTKSEIDEFLTFVENIRNNNVRKYNINDCKYTKKKKLYKPRKKEKKCQDCDKLINKDNIRCRECYLSFSKKPKLKKYPNNKCKKCYSLIFGKNLCKKCYGIKQRKINRPNIDILINEVKEFGYRKVGRKYGVSDNTIRKWIKLERCQSG